MKFCCRNDSKKLLKKLTVTVILFMAGMLCFAQNSERFKQRLEWKTDNSVLEYKIEIIDSSGKTIESISTDKGFVELSLTPGSYRYKIYAYDLLGREAVTTNWIPFDILVANQPAIVHGQNLEGLEEDGKTLELDVNIAGVTQDSIVELVSENGRKKIKGSLILGTGAEAAVSTGAGAGLAASETHNAVKARFNDVPQGNWKLVVTNPSGLSNESEVFEVRDILKEQRIAAEKAEKERLAREKKEREEAEKLAKELAKKAEEERIEREKAAKEEAERLAKEKAEREAKEKAFQEELDRIANERKQKEEEKRQEAIKIVEKQIEERIERERIEKEREEERRAEEERLALEAELREQEEAERLAMEDEEESERERKEQEKAERRAAWQNYDRKFAITPGAGIALQLYNGGLFNDFVEVSLNNFDLALTDRIDFLPVHTKSLRFGMEASLLYTTMKSTNNYYTLNFTVINGHGDLVFRVAPGKKKKFWIQFKGGAGLMVFRETLDYLGNYADNKEKKVIDYGYIEAGGGLSFVMNPTYLLALEIGADFHNVFMTNANIGLLAPYIGLGIRY